MNKYLLVREWIDCPNCDYGVQVGSHCEICNELAGGESGHVSLREIVAEDSPNDATPCRCEDYPCCGH